MGAGAVPRAADARVSAGAGPRGGGEGPGRAWSRALGLLVAWALAVAPGGASASASGPGLLRMRSPGPEAQAEPAPSAAPTEPTPTEPAPVAPDPPAPEPDPPRAYDGPTAVLDEPGRPAPFVGPSAPAEPQAAEATAALPVVTPRVPPPSSVREVPERIGVAVGLAPEAPGSRDEKALLTALEATVRASTHPTTDVRRLRPGAGAPRRICREQREDLVVMIGYIADRPTPVVLAHDCRLDRALAIRAADAVHEPGLVDALWREHLELVRAGARERRRISVGPRARAGILAGAAIVVVGVAVGFLVANALRDETVVITVRP